MTLIFTLDDPLDIAEHADASQPTDSYDALLGGLHASPTLITHASRQSGIQAAVPRATTGPSAPTAGIRARADGPAVADFTGTSAFAPARC